MSDNASAETRRDGGKWALSGFLYQAVGVAGLIARTHNLLEQGLESDGLDALVEIYGLIPESLYDQDAVLIPLEGMNKDQCAFYQFKYAQSLNNKKLTATSFQKIVAAFIKGTRAAEADGRAVFKYVLVTNREISSSVQKWIDDCELPADEIDKIVNLILGNDPKSASLTDRTRVSTEVVAVMQLFQNVFPIDNLYHFWREISDYGKRLGLSRDLIRDGIKHIIATQLLDEPEGVGKALDRIALNRELCDCDSPGELTATRIKDQYSPDIWKKVRVLPSVGEPVVRKTAESWLVERMDQGCPIFVLTGVGGMGKSTTLAHWIEKYLKARDGIILFAELASRLRCGWLGEIVHGWSGIPRLKDIGSGAAVRRLKSANQGHEIAIVIVVDGLDEVWPGDSAALNGAINELTALQESGEPLTIIATSRSDQPIHGMFNIPPELLGGEVGIPRWPVGEFDVDELGFMIRSMESSEAKGRLLQSISHPMSGLEYVEEGMINPPTIFGDIIGDTQPLGVSKEILACLKIPVIWGQFGRLDKAEQNLFLDRAESALQKVGNYLTEWLNWKLEPRLGGQHLDKLDLQDLLCKVATQTNSPGIHTRSSWIDIATKMIHRQDIASILYRETGSAGLIYLRENEREWQWASPIIRECLAKVSS